MGYHYSYVCIYAIGPGKPFTSEKKLPPEIEANVNAFYGLDQPWYIQYWDYLVTIANCDFGPSFKYKSQTVNDLINRFSCFLITGIGSNSYCPFFGVFFGVIAALNHNKWPDYSSMVIAVLGISVPSFIMATMLQYILAIKRKFSLLHFGNLHAYGIACICPCGFPLAFIARLTRSCMLEVLPMIILKQPSQKD